MSEEYGNDFISVIDDDGNEIMLEVIDTIDYNEKTYGLFLPADMNEDDPDYGWIILQVVEEDGEEVFEDVEDDDELNEVYEKFMMLIDAEEEE